MINIQATKILKMETAKGKERKEQLTRALHHSGTVVLSWLWS